ncbi:hypothetical protein [Anaplasma phagocytophilum]|uniref:Uncharacterized protein n=1 Tax=Anaplasma phagocytophilum TaxID=948 RepID=A0A098EGU8_ANAPH|nr:hypothetical protein [Anaplasma phagocytophilum]CEG21032.1 Uncharacterized protein ANAPHAGO_00300 [Anaplasma phagocytophilum]
MLVFKKLQDWAGEIAAGLGSVVAYVQNSVADKQRSDTGDSSTEYDSESSIEYVAEESEQDQGRMLYRKTKDFFEEREGFFDNNDFSYGRENSGSIVDKIYGRSMGIDQPKNPEIFQCLIGNQTRFWSSEDKAFCVHYRKSARGYDMYLHVFYGDSAILSKVNSAPFSAEHVGHYAPVYAVFECNAEYRITFVHVEDQGISPWEASSHRVNTLVLSQYVIGIDGNNSLLVEGRSYRFVAGAGEEYRAPLAVLHDVRGDVLVTGKSKGDSRLSATDQGYFLWRFSAATLQPVVRRNKMSSEIRSYLFRRFGGSSLERPEHLVLWDRQGSDRLALTYIGSYIAVEDREYYHPYKAFDAVFFRSKATARLMSLRQCLIGTHLCNIEARGGVVLTAKKMKLIYGRAIGDLRYIFYVTRSLDALRMEELSVAMLGGGTYTVLQGIIPMGFSASSINLKSVDGIHVEVMLLDTASLRANVYRIDLRQLNSKKECRIDAFSINYSSLGTQEILAVTKREVHEALSSVKESSVVIIEDVLAVEGHNLVYNTPRMYYFKSSIVKHSHAGVRDFTIRDPTNWITMGTRQGIEEKTTQVRDLVPIGTTGGTGNRTTVLRAIEESPTVEVLSSTDSVNTLLGKNGSMEVAALSMQGNNHASSITDGVEEIDANSVVHYTTVHYGVENSSTNGLLNSSANSVDNSSSIKRYNEQDAYFGVSEGIIVLGALGIIIALIVAVYAIVTYVRSRSTGYNRADVARNTPESGLAASSEYVALGDYGEQSGSVGHSTVDAAVPPETHGCTTVGCVLCKEVEATSMFCQTTSKL